MRALRVRFLKPVKPEVVPILLPSHKTQAYFWRTGLSHHFSFSTPTPNQAQGTHLSQGTAIPGPASAHAKFPSFLREGKNELNTAQPLCSCSCPCRGGCRGLCWHAETRSSVQGTGAHVNHQPTASRVHLIACVKRDAVHEEDPARFRVQPMGRSFVSGPWG